MKNQVLLEDLMRSRKLKYSLILRGINHPDGIEIHYMYGFWLRSQFFDNDHIDNVNWNNI